MIYGPDYKTQVERRKRREQWHSYYCWFPVQLEDGRRAWLERIERRFLFRGTFGDVYDYRLPAKKETTP